MAEKRFTQEELNRIVAGRIGRERERLSKEFEKKLKRCMAAVHLTLYQEMCSLKRDIEAEAMDALLSESNEIHTKRPINAPAARTASSPLSRGGEEK